MRLNDLYVFPNKNKQMFIEICNFEKGCFQTPKIAENFGVIDPVTGYTNISLRLKSGERKSFKLHRAVWMAKHGEIPKGMHILHLDSDKRNCALSNLQVGTPSENNLMKQCFGTTDIPNTKVPVIAISEDKTQLFFESISEAARKLNLTSATIGKILDKREKNKYYKNTYTPEGKKFTFVKHEVHKTTVCEAK